MQRNSKLMALKYRGRFDMDKIKNFEELISNYVGPDKVIIDTKVRNLTAPGENYMSEIIKIDVLLGNNDAAVEDVYLVAKLVTNNEFIGSTSKLMKNEVLFYTKIFPALKRFHNEHGLPDPTYVPEFVAGRINLTGGDQPDGDGVVVLENLLEKGYVNMDRHVGFDLETAKLILTDLATFHAVPLAMKLLEPETFKSEIKANEMKVELPKSRPNGSSDGFPNPDVLKPPLIYELLQDYFDRDENYSKVAARYKKYIEKMQKDMEKDPAGFFKKPPVEPFATLLHTDIWINNTMQLLQDGLPVGNKIIDYQLCIVGSPATDLLFFLFSSVRLSCLSVNLDALLVHYHEKFGDVLKACDCYGPQFSYGNFLNEIQLNGKDSIGRTLFMLPNVIFGKKGEAFKIKDAQETTLDDLPKEAREKLIFMCVEATERNWI